MICSDGSAVVGAFMHASIFLLCPECQNTKFKNFLPIVHEFVAQAADNRSAGGNLFYTSAVSRWLGQAASRSQRFRLIKMQNVGITREKPSRDCASTIGDSMRTSFIAKMFSLLFLRSSFYRGCCVSGGTGLRAGGSRRLEWHGDGLFGPCAPWGPRCRNKGRFRTAAGGSLLRGGILTTFPNCLQGSIP